MRHPLIRDVMTTDVRSVRRSTPFKDIAVTLAGRGVSAVPVVDEERTVVGVVSEADLLYKEIPRGRWSWWWRHKSGATVAQDLMTSPAVTIGPDEPIAEGARRMTREHVKRLPVVDRYGKLLGIVSRTDLLRIFVRPDAELREDVVHEVFERALGVPPPRSEAAVAVVDGVVTLTGELERKSLIPVAVTLTRRVPGVVDVVAHLTFAVDDSHFTGWPPHRG